MFPRVSESHSARRGEAGGAGSLLSQCRPARLVLPGGSAVLAMFVSTAATLAAGPVDTATATVGATSAAATALGAGVDEAVGLQQPEGSSVILAVRHQSLASLMPSPKDANLAAAVNMVSLRLRELPLEIARVSGSNPDLGEIAGFVDWALPLFASAFEYPAEFAILDNGFNEYNARDIDVRMVVETGSREEALRLRDNLSSLLNAAAQDEMMLTPSTIVPTMMSLQTPFATMLWGPVNEAGRFAVGIDLGGDGLVTDAVPIHTPAGFPEGVTPVFEMEVNAGPVLDLANMVAEMMGMQMGNDIISQMQADMPPGGIGMRYALGFDRGRAVSVTRYNGLNAMQQGLEMMGRSGETITDAVLQTVPRDARMLQVSMINLHDTIVNALAESGMGPEGAREYLQSIGQEIEDEIGFDPINNFLIYLGDAWVGFTADSTGGGGVMSMTLINQGVDRSALGPAMERMAAIANAMAGQAMGYVRVRAWSEEEVTEVAGSQDAKAWSLTFPGLPAPIEFSVGLVGDALIVGLSPQAIAVTAEQVVDGRNSILGSPAFQRAVEAVSWENAVQLRFVDTQANIDRGYAAVLMGGTALGNFVRSPLDAERGPGTIVPPLRQLRRAVFPAISVTRVEGDDVVTIGYADASWLANVAGYMGSLGGLQTMIPAMFAAGSAAAASN